MMWTRWSLGMTAMRSKLVTMAATGSLPRLLVVFRGFVVVAVDVAAVTS